MTNIVAVWMLFIGFVKYVGGVFVVHIQKPMTLFLSGEKSFFFSSWRTRAVMCSHLVFPIFSVSGVLLTWPGSWQRQQLCPNLVPDQPAAAVSPSLFSQFHFCCCVSVSHTHKSAAIFLKLIYRPTYAAGWGPAFIAAGNILACCCFFPPSRVICGDKAQKKGSVIRCNIVHSEKWFMSSP